MELYELLQSSIDISSKIDVLWGMFITVHAGIFGFLYIKEVTLNRFQMIVLSVGYTCFFFLNFVSLHSSYLLLQALHSDMLVIKDYSSANNLEKYLRSIDLDHLSLRTALFHFIAFLGVIIAIYRNRRTERSE